MSCYQQWRDQLRLPIRGWNRAFVVRAQAMKCLMMLLNTSMSFYFNFLTLFQIYFLFGNQWNSKKLK
jgi:hypothetical protein